MPKTKRLFKDFQPENYSLELNLNKKNKNFSGSLTILGFRKAKPSNRLTLHQSGLKLTEARLFKLEKTQEVQLEVERITHHKSLQEVRIHTKQQISSSKYRLEVQYSGRVSRRGTSGVYVSTWKDTEGQKQEIITTQFEPHHARTLLPCVDEPEAKATFDLKLNLQGLAKDSEETALFNTPIASRSNNQLTFERTPTMSSYLLALIIGDLNARSLQTESGTQISIYSTPLKTEDTQYALDFSNKVLEILEDLFGEKYPLAKLDLVAIPDFDAGGMENWGLITFREEYLLYSEKLSTLSDKQIISLIIAHELTHQWFGNLVTMKWWDELWLNEGFANFMEYYLVDQIYPEWKIFESYLVFERNSAVRMDSLPSSRSIISKVEHTHQAVDAFDSIVYEKSGNIIRMIYHLIGKEPFFKGLSDYFSKYQYKNATSAELIACWQKQATKNIKLSELLKPWLNQPGLPKLSIQYNNAQKSLILRQERFFSEPKGPTDSEQDIQKELAKRPDLSRLQRQFYQNNLTNRLSAGKEYNWSIPVDLVYAGGANPPKFVVSKKKHTHQLVNDSLPLKLNSSGAGFYVVEYPLEMLATASKAIQAGEMEDIETLNLLLDQILLEKSSQFTLEASALLEIIYSARANHNPHFWSLIGGFISFLNLHLKQEGQELLLQPFTQKLIQKALKEIGTETPKAGSESDQIVSTRFELLSLGALSKEEEVCRLLLDGYRQAKDIKSIDPEKRILSFYVLANQGDSADYESLLKLYQENMEDHSLRDDVAYALCKFKDLQFVKRNLQFAQDPDMVREQDILTWLSQIISSGKAGTKEVLKWITEADGWSWLEQHLSDFDLSSAVKLVLSTSYTQQDLDELLSFFTKLNKPEIGKSLSEAQDVAKSRILWHNTRLSGVIKYLQNTHKN